MPKLRLVHLYKTYIKGQMDGVRDLNMDVEEGEFVSLLGPSGCGKSSTLRMIAGLEDVTQGEIWLNDQMINDVIPQERNIAMVFENYALYTHKTVYENIAFPLMVRKIGAEEIRRKLDNVAQVLQIEDILHEKAINLSGGQKQRVSIGRAIVRDPELLLMDEPISHLEAKLKTHMRAELKRLQRQLGRTTLYVTHDQYEAMTMADRIAVMNKARLQQYDIPQKLFLRPYNEFVAGFIGEPPMNMFDCELVEEGGTLHLVAPNFKVAVPESVSREIKDEQIKDQKAFRLGIRPQDMRPQEQSGNGRQIEGKVFHWEIHGDEGVLMAKVSDNLVMVNTPEDFKAASGEVVHIGFNPEKINIFNARTTKNICVSEEEFNALSRGR